jgi:hypothetical protein
MRNLSLALLSVVLLVSCTDDPAPLVPASINLVTSPPTTGVAGSAVATAATFEVRTAKGKAIKGIPVTVQVGLSSGSVVSTPSITGSTPTPVGQWTLGITAGTQSLRVLSGSLPELLISMQAVAGPLAQLSILEGDNQRAAGSSDIPFPMRVKTADQHGNGIAGVTVTWAVTAGGGSVALPTSVSNASGIAVAPTWTLGPDGSGGQILQASSGAFTADFDAVLQAPPSSITIGLSPPATVPAGSTLNVAPTFVVRDAGGVPLDDIPVTVTVTAGGGSLAGAPTLSLNGPTPIGSWTVGGGFGAQTVTVAVAGIPSAMITTTSGSLYELEVVYTGTPPSSPVQAAFADAVARVKTVIVGEMSQVAFSPAFNAGSCLPGLVIDGDTIPGLRIYVSIEAIDGPGGTLGSAGPCYLRNSNSLTVVGRMRFDTADMDNLAANGSLGSVILHEMMHVIGVGTLWTTTGNNLGSAPGSTPLFIGPLAQAACIGDHAGASVCGGGVPREDCLNLAQACGAGTINSHWKESVFRTEMMTGYLNAGSNPFSKMTMQSLADIGYQTTFFTADAYVVPPPSLMSLFEAPTIKLGEPTGPIAKVDAQGRITHRFPQPQDQ